MPTSTKQRRARGRSRKDLPATAKQIRYLTFLRRELGLPAEGLVRCSDLSRELAGWIIDDLLKRRRGDRVLPVPRAPAAVHVSEHMSESRGTSTLTVEVPYDAAFNDGARDMGGRWYDNAWHFGTCQEDQLAALLDRTFPGWDRGG